MKGHHAIQERPGNPYRLGRHLHHDERSRAFPAALAPALRSVTHQHHGPVLNQGNLGSCTGNALCQALNTGPLAAGRGDTRPLLTEADAVRIYSEATILDPFDGAYPPDDTGSDGVSVCKAAQGEGLISRYTHTFSGDACRRALVLQPVIIGTIWYESMFDPDFRGRVHVRPSSGVAGGHEYCLYRLDVPHKRVWFINSWGEGWGKGGTAYLTWHDLDLLLDDGGDCTAPVV